jgi:hypothetical protein
MTNHIKTAFGVLGLLLCAMLCAGSLEATVALDPAVGVPDATELAVPEPGTACNLNIDRWLCSYNSGPGGKPAGWYTPSSAIPAGKMIFKGCSSVCNPIPLVGGCIYVPEFVERPNHPNDLVLASGARRAWCGTNASHAVEYWTIRSAD